MRNSKIQYELKQRGINIQVVFASHAAYSLLVSCFRRLALLQRKHRVDTVILKLRDKTDSTDRVAADYADFCSACRFRSFRRFYVSFYPNFPVMLIVLDH